MNYPASHLLCPALLVLVLVCSTGCSDAPPPKAPEQTPEAESLVINVEDNVLGPRDGMLYALVNLGPHLALLQRQPDPQVRPMVEAALTVFAEGAFTQTWDTQYSTLYIDVVTVTKVDSYGEPDYPSAIRNGSITFHHSTGEMSIAENNLDLSGLATASAS